MPSALVLFVSLVDEASTNCPGAEGCHPCPAFGLTAAVWFIEAFLGHAGETFSVRLLAGDG